MRTYASGDLVTDALQELDGVMRERKGSAASASIPFLKVSTAGPLDSG